jgi:hypothetical protein
MNFTFLVTIYKTFLNLYPRNYRLLFASEMVEVFRQSVSDAAQQSRSTFWKVILHELCDLPIASAKEHISLLFNGNTTATPSSPSMQSVVSRKELFVTLAAFTIPLILIMLNNPTEYLVKSLPAALVFIALVVIAGLLREIPRWCLPYLGLALSIVGFIVIFNWLADQILPTVPPWLGPGPREQSTRLLWQGFLTGMMWFSLFMVGLSAWFILGFVRWMRRLRLPALQGDWPKISFVFYAGGMTALVLMFKDHYSREPFAIVSLLFLAAGAWVYLRSSQPWRRLAALLAGVTLAFGIAAVGIWLKVPLQPWSWEGLWNTAETERWFEAWRVMLVWIWLMFFLLTPVMTKYLEDAGSHITSRDGNEPAIC